MTSNLQNINCSHSRKPFHKNLTCFRLSTLLAIYRLFKFKLNTKINRKLLYDELSRIFKLPDTHWGVLFEKYGLKDIANFCYLDHVPYIPKEQFHGWLRGSDINEYLNYIQNYKALRFRTFGVLGGSDIEVNARKKQIFKTKYILPFVSKKQTCTKFAWVYNIDRVGRGSHWVVVFMNLTSKTLNYFDSFGHPPPKWIENDIKVIVNHFKTIDTLHLATFDFTLQIHKIKKQKGSNECGMFVLWYINTMLNKNMTFDKFEKISITDNDCKILRSKYFLNKNKIMNEITNIDLNEIVNKHKGIFPEL